MSKNGLILLTPTSIAYTGTSASIGANGSVTFASITSLTLNGIFTSDYDNYMVVFRNSQNSSSDTHQARLVSSGTQATANNYSYERLAAYGTTVDGARTLNAGFFRITYGWANRHDGYVLHVYGPYLARSTAFRSISASTENEAYIEDQAATHSLSTSYDGLYLFPDNPTATHTGRVAVYGMRK